MSHGSFVHVDDERKWRENKNTSIVVSDLNITLVKIVLRLMKNFVFIINALKNL